MARIKRSHILNQIGSFAIAFFVVMVFIFLTAFLTVYRAGYIKSTYVNCSYYGATMRAVTTDIAKIENESVILVTGSGKVNRKTSLMAKSIKWAELEKDINSLVDVNYSIEGAESSLNKTKITNGFYNAVVDNCNSKKISLSSDDKKIIKSAAQRAYTAYESRLNIESLDKYCSAVKSNKALAGTLAILSIIISCATFIFMFRSNVWKHRAVRFGIYALISAGTVLFLIPLIMLATNYVNTLGLTADPILADLATAYLNGIFGYMVVFGIVIIVAAVCMAVFVYPRFAKISDE